MEKKIKFYSQTYKKEMKIEKWGGDFWLFYKHPDGQWVSLRKASDSDYKEIEKAEISQRDFVNFYLTPNT